MSEEKQVDVTEPEVVNDLLDDELEGLDVDALLPAIQTGKEVARLEKEECIVKDDEILGLYKEILDNCRKDREHADEILGNFLDMVLNDGDASSASKEAIVNILKIKSDSADKMTKIADLMTRIHLKDRDTFPRYLAQTQVNIDSGSNKRELLKSVNKLTSQVKARQIPKGTPDDKKN